MLKDRMNTLLKFALTSTAGDNIETKVIINMHFHRYMYT